MIDNFQRFLAKRPYVVFVVVPMALLLLYYAFFATDRYLSEATLIVERDSPAPTGLDLGLFSIGGGSSILDAELVKSFIESSTMLEHLDQTLQLREHYSQPGIDPFSRLSASASRETFLKYYLHHTEVSIDPTAMTVDLAVQAFDPEFSRKLGQVIVERAERFVNDVSQSLAREQVAFMRKELEHANERLQNTTSELVAYQKQNELLSVEIETQAASQIIAGLQTQLASERTNLKSLSSYLNRAAPEVVASLKRVAAIQAQIEQERGRQVGSADDPALNDMLLKNKELELAVELASQLYQTSLQSLDRARLEAARKVKFLVSVSAPTLPEDSKRPRRGYILISAFVLLNVLYLIGTLLVATIKDHQE